jgi:hypothetical protein
LKRVHRLPDGGIATLSTESSMGKYIIGWLLGIPAIVLVILYLFFH